MKDDLISRQEVLALPKNITRNMRGEIVEETIDVAAIKALPSVQQWIPCSEKMPPDYQWYYATCKSLVDNRENWVVEGCYTPWEHFNSTPMIKCGEAEVIAWMPKEFPEPWDGGQE